MENYFHIADLIAKKNKKTITTVEMQELEMWANANDENKQVYTKATDEQFLLDNLEVYDLFKSNEVWRPLEDKLFKTKTVRLFSHNWMRYAAALIPLMAALSLTWYYYTRPETHNLASIDNIAKPGTEKAMLILADGREVNLEEMQQMEPIDQPGAIITAEQQGLAYTSETDDEDPKPLVYNELVIPRGGRYNLKLADGTEVWLNAGSSLKFPVAFNDSTRVVFLTGEAYFEVAHHNKPFIVNSGEMAVRVLGTTFNISAYEDEAVMRTTLVEGSVKIMLGNTSDIIKTLAPNDQAIISKDDATLEVTAVNTDQYTSWVQGKLEFNNDNLEVVMKRLARWYDFEFEFENVSARNFHFTARIKNDQNISSILEMLEMTTDVKFEIRDNKIIVL